MSHLTEHELCERALATGCSCGAEPGTPCRYCAPGDLHMCRFTRAVGSDLLDMDDMGYLIRKTSKMTFHDPGVAVA